MIGGNKHKLYASATATAKITNGAKSFKKNPIPILKGRVQKKISGIFH